MKPIASYTNGRSAQQTPAKAVSKIIPVLDSAFEVPHGQLPKRQQRQQPVARANSQAAKYPVVFDSAICLPH